MLQMDFAYLYMMKSKRQGLAGRKFFLDRLAPSFYAPRVERLISFSDYWLKGCNIFLPLGRENWEMLDYQRKIQVIQRGQQLLGDFSLQEMAIDRRLKPLFAEFNDLGSLCFGDDFIKALAIVLTRETLRREKIERIIVAGMVPGIEGFLKSLALFDTPITIQNFQPNRYEIMVYRLLYEKGLAVSNNRIQPHCWSSGDIVLAFEPGFSEAALTVPGLIYYGLHNNGQGLAPALEKITALSGAEPGLHTLAPIFESCLYAKAGFKRSDREVNTSRKDDQSNSFEMLVQIGDELGLWEPFLDKGW